MPVVEELIRTEQDGTISFGNYKLGQKSKKSDFEYQGDIYKVKTYNEITKLERNEMFVYESVPGTVAEHFKVTDDSIEFEVEGDKDAQITVQLENDTDYKCMRRSCCGKHEDQHERKVKRQRRVRRRNFR